MPTHIHLYTHTLSLLFFPFLPSLSPSSHPFILSPNQATPLYAAAKAGNVPAVQLLLRAPAIQLDQSTRGRATPLNIACR